MKKISHRLKQVKVNAHTIVQIVFIFWLLVFTNKASAQENHGEEGEKVRDTTYIFPTATFYPSVITLGNGQNERDAQGLTIVDHADVRVLSSSFFQQSEPHISIDRNNPQNLILSANNQNLNTGLEDQGYYYSNNGGSTWTGNDHFPGPLTIPGIGAARSGGDPSTAFNLNGDAFISTLELKFRGFFSATSLAGSSAGSTWSTPTYIVDPISFDKEMIAADNIANSPYANSLYCVGTEFFDNAAALCIDPSAPTANLSFFRSTDNWATSSRIADLRNNANGYGDGANVQTGPNGEVFVCWTDLPNNSLPSSNIGFAYSADGGLTFSNSSNAIFTSTQYAGGVLMNCDQDFSTNIIHDPKFGVAQQTYGPAGAIYNSQHVDGTGYIKMNDFPSMAVDRGCGTSNHPGRVYIAFPEQYYDTSGAGLSSLIAVSYLDPGHNPPYYTGAWSTPAVVSIYPGGYPGANANPSDAKDNNYSHATFSFFPSITVDDANGIVSVAYYSFDGLNNPTGNTPNATNTYVAYSTNGGDTYNNIKVSDVFHLTAPIPGYSTYTGDYISIAAYNGKAYVAWTDNRIQIPATTVAGAGGVTYDVAPSSLWQIYVSEVDFTGVCNSHTTINTLNVSGNIIVPAAAATTVYEAAQIVIVPATGNTFQTLSGSHVDIRACEEVNLRDGFSASNELHAYIECIPTCVSCPIGQRLSASNTSGPASTTQPKKVDEITTKLGTNTTLGIFPNPTSGVVYLNLSAQNPGNLLVNIRDINGKQVIHTAFSANEGANSFKVDLSSLNQGVYFITVTDENGTTIKNDKLMLLPQ